MLPLGLSILIFLFLMGVGQAVLAALKLRGGLLRSWLLSPAVGLAVLSLCLMIGSQAGWPIRSFAWPLFLGLIAVSAGLLAWRRPRCPGRCLAPFLAVAIVFLFWTGWPALRFGFNWISYVNQDFTNYCLSAQRFMDNGFYRPPTPAELAGTDYSQYFWFMYVTGLMRFSADQGLACLAVLMGKNPLFVFMPLILALGMTQIFATAAVVLHAGRWRRYAFWSAALLAVSPLFMLGILYQLIAQAGGLALMLALLALLTTRSLPSRRRPLMAHAAVTALVAAGLCIYYPEVSPFAALSLGLYGLMEWVTTRRFPTFRLLLGEYVFVGMVPLLRHNLFSYVYVVIHQYLSAVLKPDLTMAVFPFFLIPSGLAGLFGLQTQTADPSEPYASILIVAGFILLVFAVVAGLRQTRRTLPIGCLFVVQFLLAAKLFEEGHDFGLYKLAMFIQPALAGVFIYGLLRLPRSRVTVPLAAVIFFGLIAPTGWHYAELATGTSSGGFVELRNASVLVGRPIPAAPAGAHWASGIDNVVAVELADSFYRGTDIKFISRDFFGTQVMLESAWWPLAIYPHRELFDYGRYLLEQREGTLATKSRLFGAVFAAIREPVAPSAYLQLPPQLSLLNKAHGQGGGAGRLFTLQQASDVSNLLVFVHSSRGYHYYSYHYSKEQQKNIAFFQQEPDPYGLEGAANGVGRFMLLRVERPSDSLYVNLALSKTRMGFGHTALPPHGQILGAEPVPMNLIGNGAAHRLVGPVKPVWLDGIAYIAIDFGQAPEQFPSSRRGLKGLYHKQVPLDYRWLVTYARDISALSAADCAALPVPRRLADFPRDLMQPSGLEFSGIYEDGWISAESEFKLGVAHAGELIRVKGFVPRLPDQAMDGVVSVVINGGPPRQFPSHVGPFDQAFEIPNPGPLTRLRLSFSTSGRLPGGDGRPIGGKVELIEISSPRAAAATGH